MSDIIKLRRCVLNITARCNLKCKLCVMGAPYYDVPPHYSYDIIAKSIDRIFDLVDTSQWIEFSGGEPFLHEDLHRMIPKAMEYSDRFETLQILTNGSMMPSKAIQEQLILHKDKIMIMISHYGEHLSRKVDEITDFCETHHIELDVKKYFGNQQHFDGWVDYGGFEKRNHNEETLCSLFKNCGSTKMEGCFTTHGGQMHWCVPSARGMKLLGEIPDCKDDYIDLFDETLTTEQQKQKFKTLQNTKYISACNHCDGFHGTSDKSKRYPAAEQLS